MLLLGSLVASEGILRSQGLWICRVQTGNPGRVLLLSLLVALEGNLL